MTDSEIAIERLTAWVRDHGDSKPQVFMGDVSLLLLLAGEAKNLRAFKDYVHSRLDAAGVPSNPDPEKTQETGCRIGSRLNWLFGQVAELNCPAAAGFEGPDTFPDCGDCVVCRARKATSA